MFNIQYAMEELRQVLADACDNADATKPMQCQYNACGDISFPKCRYCQMTKEERTQLPIIEYLRYLNSHMLIPQGSELQKAISLMDVSRGAEGLRFAT